MKTHYDYLVVGAGLFGSVFAERMNANDKSVCVIDVRNHIGGNCYSEKIKNIHVHRYGPHIFHTDSFQVWEYINNFSEFTPFKNQTKTLHQGRFYPFPINLLTLNQIWGVQTPEEAAQKLNEVSAPYQKLNPANFEEWVLSQVGKRLYDMFYKDYTEKLWGDPTLIPASTAQRIPIRLDFNSFYYNDPYQGIPTSGYTNMFEALLAGIDVKLQTKYSHMMKSLADKVLYTGRIDDFYNYKLGRLDYRNLILDEEVHHMEVFQGGPVINYPEKRFKFVRSTEHKYFLQDESDFTVITREYPHPDGEPCYPVRNKKNLEKLRLYQNLADADKQILMGGRLGMFQYFDMDDTILAALNLVEKELTDA